MDIDAELDALLHEVPEAHAPPAKRQKTGKKRKSTMVSRYKADTRKQLRQEVIEQTQKANSDYAVVETVAKPVRSETAAPQPVDQTTTGSRMEIHQLKKQTLRISNRLTYASKKLKTLLKSQPTPELSECINALQNVQTDMTELPRQIDRAISASSTLALLEGRNWRSLPHCLVHGLVYDAVTADRAAELTARLARTPLQWDQTQVEADAQDTLAKYTEALAAEINAVTESTPAHHTMRHAQQLICTQYEQAILSGTAAQSAERTQRYNELTAVRSLMKLTRHERLKPPPAPALILLDPLERVASVPAAAIDP